MPDVTLYPVSAGALRSDCTRVSKLPEHIKAAIKKPLLKCGGEVRVAGASSNKHYLL
jgi:hypothetical protein